MKAETCSGRGIKCNKRLEQLLRRTVFLDNLDKTSEVQLYIQSHKKTLKDTQIKFYKTAGFSGLAQSLAN
jgi:hypothetical protein